MDQPNYYAIIPANVRYDHKLKANAKLLYGEITALCGAQGFCWAKNDYFAALYNAKNETISRWISQLQNRGYIHVEINKQEGNTRKILLSNDLLTKKSIPIDEKVNTLLTKKSIPIDKKVNSIYMYNNTINNTRENSAHAIQFLKENAPSRLEVFQMQYKSKIDNWEKFVKDFDNKVIIEGLDFDVNKLFARLETYAGNWIANKAKTNEPIVSVQNIKFN
jgi:hypothetical protein